MRCVLANTVPRGGAQCGVFLLTLFLEEVHSAVCSC